MICCLINTFWCTSFKSSLSLLLFQLCVLVSTNYLHCLSWQWQTSAKCSDAKGWQSLSELILIHKAAWATFCRSGWFVATAPWPTHLGTKAQLTGPESTSRETIMVELSWTEGGKGNKETTYVVSSSWTGLLKCKINHKNYRGSLTASCLVPLDIVNSWFYSLLKRWEDDKTGLCFQEVAEHQKNALHKRALSVTKKEHGSKDKAERTLIQRQGTRGTCR